MTTLPLFMRHVIRADDDGCWLWTGATARNGYGQVGHNGKTCSAHKVSYLLHIGPVPDGLQLDHTCHDPKTCEGGDACPHRRCVNPAHLEPVTPLVNNSRANRYGEDKCRNGHDWTPENTRYRKSGVRICRACVKNERAKRLVGYGKPGRPSKAARLALEAQRLQDTG